MAIMINDPFARGFFKVVTGDPFPAVNEDELFRAADSWFVWAGALGVRVMQDLVMAVRKIRRGVFGEADQAFADQLAKYVTEPPMYLPEGAEQFRRSGDILRGLALQAAVMKRALLVELLLLIAEFLAALATFVPTFGQSMASYAVKAALFRFFAKTALRRFLTAILTAQVIGIGT